MNAGESLRWREKKCLRISIKAGVISAFAMFFISFFAIPSWNSMGGTFFIFVFLFGTAFSAITAFINSEILHEDDPLLRASIHTSLISALIIFTSMAILLRSQLNISLTNVYFSPIEILYAALSFFTAFVLFGYIFLIILQRLKKRFHPVDLTPKEGFILGFTVFLTITFPSLYFVYILDDGGYISTFLPLVIPALGMVGMIENKYLHDKSGTGISALISILAFFISYIIFFSIVNINLDPGSENCVACCQIAYIPFSLFFIIGTLIFYNIYNSIRKIRYLDSTGVME